MFEKLLRHPQEKTKTVIVWYHRPDWPPCTECLKIYYAKGENVFLKQTFEASFKKAHPTWAVIDVQVKEDDV
jgi:hypothetical protein